MYLSHKYTNFTYYLAQRGVFTLHFDIFFQQKLYTRCTLPFQKSFSDIKEIYFFKGFAKRRKTRSIKLKSEPYTIRSGLRHLLVLHFSVFWHQ